MSNGKVIFLSLVVIIGMVAVPTGYKIYKNYQNNLIKVVEKEFLYQANNCFYEAKCQDKTIYLRDLYDKEYIKEEMTNPLNKKYYSKDSYINLETGEIKLVT